MEINNIEELQKLCPYLQTNGYIAGLNSIHGLCNNATFVIYLKKKCHEKNGAFSLIFFKYISLKAEIMDRKLVPQFHLSKKLRFHEVF